MKRFSELTADEQTRAIKQEIGGLLEDILQGAIRFNDKLNGDDLQARIDAACAKADAMCTPWFAHEYIMDTCGDEIEGMARATAEDAIFPDPDEYVIILKGDRT